MRQKAIEAVIILNQFVVDLITGVRLYELFHGKSIKEKIAQVNLIGINRMCFWYIFITLTKWIEFYKKYKQVVTSDCERSCRKLFKDINNKGILDFRNKVVGHIWDDDKKRPLTAKEVEMYVNEITHNDDSKFLHWINDPNNNIFPNTVVSIVEKTRNRIIEDNKITNEELFQSEE